MIRFLLLVLLFPLAKVCWFILLLFYLDSAHLECTLYQVILAAVIASTFSNAEFGSWWSGAATIALCALLPLSFHNRFVDCSYTLDIVGQLHPSKFYGIAV